MGNWDFCCNAAVPAQNTKKLNRTKNNCVRVQLGQIMNKKIQQPNKQTRSPTTTSREPGAKTGGERKGTAHAT